MTADEFIKELMKELKTMDPNRSYTSIRSGSKWYFFREPLWSDMTEMADAINEATMKAQQEALSELASQDDLSAISAANAKMNALIVRAQSEAVLKMTYITFVDIDEIDDTITPKDVINRQDKNINTIPGRVVNRILTKYGGEGADEEQDF